MSNHDQFNIPKINVIIPVYKVEKYLDRCLKSVLEQSYSDIEVILVDDGSPDQCGVMCDEYAKKDPRIKVIHKKNGGLASARNAGLEAASAEFICFVDSDDWITKDMFQYMIELAQQNAADIVSVSYVLTDSEHQTIDQNTVNVRVMERNEALEYFLDIGMRSRVSDYPVCIKMFRRELFEDIRFPMGRLYEDLTTNVQLIQKAKIYVKSSKICYFYFQGGSSIVRSGYKKKDDDLIFVCKETLRLTAKEHDTIIKLCEQKLARAYFSLLTKIAVYGFAEELQKEERRKITGKFTKEIRKNFFCLMGSGMPISRKMILCILCIDYRLLIPVRILKERIK